MVRPEPAARRPRFISRQIPDLSGDLSWMLFDDPDFRATITARRVTLVSWHDHLFRPSGPAAHLFRPRPGAVIADLTVLRDEDGAPHELIVAVHSGRLTGEPRQRLVDWAGALGYHRLWLPGEIVQPPSSIDAIGETARTRCPSCRAAWTDGEFAFWDMVRRSGYFPLACPVCGGDLVVGYGGPSLMDVRIHRGADQVGGTCVEVRSGRDRRHRRADSALRHLCGHRRLSWLLRYAHAP